MTYKKIIVYPPSEYNLFYLPITLKNESRLTPCLTLISFTSIKTG